MNRIVLEIFAATALTMAAIIAFAAGARAGDIVVSQAFARASATPSARSASLYLTLTNRGSAADRLVAVITTKAQMAHVHESANSDGVMKMRILDDVALAPGASVAFKPGGLHIMLMGLRSPLTQGQTLKLTLTFAKSDALVVTVPIAGVAADRPDQASGSTGG